MRTRSKICGITRLEDARVAINSGVDAIGLVFYPPSPRAVTPIQAQKIAQVIPPYVQIVGLFVNASLAEIKVTLQYVAIDVLQFHGDESPSQCATMAQQLGRRWYKAIQVRPELDVHTEIQRYAQAGASAVLLDAWHPNIKGGTGHTFDWSVFPKSNTPLILAGGLTPDNVKQAIITTTPFAVDVSGGVESAKGIKDHQLIKAFMQGVHCGSANED